MSSASSTNSSLDPGSNAETNICSWLRKNLQVLLSLPAFRPGHAPGARDMKQRRRALRRTTEEDLGPAGPAAAHRAKAPRIISALDS